MIHHAATAMPTAPGICFMPHVPGSINSHHFHIIGDKLINSSTQSRRGLYIHYKDSRHFSGWRFPIPKDQGVELRKTLAHMKVGRSR